MTNLIIRRPGSLLTGFRPFDLLLRDFEQSFRDWLDTDGRSSPGMEMIVPRANIAETDKEFLVTLELPGLEHGDVEVKLAGNELIVTGERKQKKEDKDKNFHRVETVFGTFERRFELPAEVRNEPDSFKATFHNGMLEIRLQKREPKPVTKIQVKAV